MDEERQEKVQESPVSSMSEAAETALSTESSTQLADDSRVATSPQNPVTGQDQPVSEPAQQGDPHENDTQTDVKPNEEPSPEPTV
jgi:hypothetical protein